MKFIVKCWKSKNGKICKALYYETDKGRFWLTFDKWVIVSLLGDYKRYKELKDGDEIVFYVYLESEVNIK